jgi:uncharacterized protein (TIGR02466 family)
MELIPIFSNFIVKEELSLDNFTIRDYSRKVCNGVVNFQFDSNDEVMQPLYSIVEQKLNDVHKQIGLSDDYHQVIGQAWLNPSIVRWISTPHNHPRYCLSAVYYASASNDSGDLILLSPNAQHTQILPSQTTFNCIKDYNSITSAIWRMKPKTGTLLIFPSWLFHYVESGNGTERVSVAFDSELKKNNVSMV